MAAILLVTCPGPGGGCILGGGWVVGPLGGNWPVPCGGSGGMALCWGGPPILTGGAHLLPPGGGGALLLGGPLTIGLCMLVLPLGGPGNTPCG